MAYFNHAFNKVFLGTQVSGSGAGQNPNANLSDGFIINDGISTAQLAVTGTSTANNNYGPGSYGFFDPKTWLSVDSTFVTATSCCPLVLAAASLMGNDKIGPFHGGYQESNKSKIINPKYIRRFYKVEPCTPQQAVISIGVTPYTAASSPAPACGFEFLCGETYNLRIDIKGSPALRMLNHNAYQTLAAYTGCCAGPEPAVVDSTLVMIEWASQIANNPYLQYFVAPVVFDEAGTPWYAPGTTVSPLGVAVTSGQWWDSYVSPGHVDGETAGIRLFGAYVDTKFGNCSFQLTDFFEKQPVKLYASLVDLTGDPCTFEGLCVETECLGVQGMGFGEQVARDLILSESYLQNHFPTDIRMREIEQGDDILNAVDRNALYTRYYILHSVPRFNNPSGVFDNDQYLLEIISSDTNADLEDFMEDWLDTCANCVTMETVTCTPCTITPDA